MAEIRKAAERDVLPVAAIYEHIISEEEAGRVCIGWQRGVYPTEATARAALNAGDLFVDERGGRIAAAAANSSAHSSTSVFFIRANPLSTV